MLEKMRLAGILLLGENVGTKCGKCGGTLDMSEALSRATVLQLQVPDL